VAPPSELESWQIATVLHDRVGADPEAGPAVGRLRLGDEFSIELRRNR
jgi:hypothetical protein